jgi:S1-C subfamily serine protease
MTSLVCPRCGAASPVRLADGEACAACLSEDAWEHWARAGKLVIDRAAIAALEARERRAAARRALGYGAAAAALLTAALAALSAYLIARQLAPHAVGSPSALAEELRRSAEQLGLCGVASLGAGLLSLRLPSPRRGGLVIRAGSLSASVAGGAALLLAAFSHVFMGPLRDFDHLSMPARSGEDLPAPAGRATNATVLIAAPDERGDALGGAVGTGAVLARDARRALVVTCSHVAMPYAAVGARRDPASALPVWVQLADGREASGRVVWTAEPPLDVALVEVLLDALPEPVSLSLDTEGIEAGDDVFFVPNPLRRGFRVEHGKVLRREVHDTPAGRFSLLFTDLPVQPGDSGRGLYDARGRLIGLNTWSRSGPLGPQGISLPSEAMAEVARVMPAPDAPPPLEATP